MKQQAVAKAAGKSSAAPTVDRLRALRRFTRENAPEVLALLGGAAFWEVLGWSLGLQWLPPFSKVMEALAQFVGSGVILANLGSSLRGLIVGFSLALILGLFLGSLMGRYRPVEKALDIYVHAFFVCPSIVFAPIEACNQICLRRAIMWTTQREEFEVVGESADGFPAGAERTWRGL